MTNPAWPHSTICATSSRSTTCVRRWTVAPIRTPSGTPSEPAAATTPAARCSGTTLPTAVSPPASRGSRPTPTIRPSTLLTSGTTTRSVFAYYRQFVEFRHANAIIIHDNSPPCTPSAPCSTPPAGGGRARNSPWWPIRRTTRCQSDLTCNDPVTRSCPATTSCPASTTNCDHGKHACSPPRPLGY